MLHNIHSAIHVERLNLPPFTILSWGLSPFNSCFPLTRVSRTQVLWVTVLLTHSRGRVMSSSFTYFYRLFHRVFQVRTPTSPLPASLSVSHIPWQWLRTLDPRPGLLPQFMEARNPFLRPPPASGRNGARKAGFLMASPWSTCCMDDKFTFSWHRVSCNLPVKRCN